VITFDDFRPGATMGESVQTLTPELAAGWQRIFGSDPAAGGAAQDASLLVVMMMRAYLAVVAPRPPGNVHARQGLRLHGLPRPGEAVRNVVRCLGKERRRERRCVDLEIVGTGADGRALYTGTMALIWAA
jgi:acyl dehydratase